MDPTQQHYIAAARFALDHECQRHGLEPLDEEQRAALEDPAQCFEMIDDMEARMGLHVTDARWWLIVAHEPEARELEGSASPAPDRS